MEGQAVPGEKQSITDRWKRARGCNEFFGQTVVKCTVSKYYEVDIMCDTHCAH